MPGLLDAINNDDARFGIGLLAAAGPSATPLSFGQRLQGALGAFDANKLQQKKLGLLDAQMDNLKSESATRQAALAKQQALLDLFNPQPTAPGASMLTTQPGQLGSGSFGIVSPPAGAPAIPQSPAAGASRIGSLTPDKLAQLKLLGVDMTDVYKLTQPDIEFVNGVAVDKRATAPGTSIPQMSPNGQGYQLIPDATAPGGFRVTTPAGAVDAFTRFKRAEAQVNADNDLVKIVSPDGAERYVSRSTVLGGAQPPAPTAPTRPGALVQPGDADRAAIFGQELEAARGRLASAKTPEEQNRARTDLAALEREIRALPPSAQPAGFQATPTTAQAAAAAGERVTAEQVAKDVAEQRKSIMTAGFVAPSNIARYQQIGKLLQDVDGGTLTATGTNLASLANSLGLKIDKNLPNKEAAASLANAAALELRNPAGGAGMPGALSDADRAFLSSMTPNMSQSAQGRKQVIDAYIAVQQRNQQVAQFARNYEKKYGRLDNGFFSQLQSWSNANPLFKGQ